MDNIKVSIKKVLKNKWFLAVLIIVTIFYTYEGVGRCLLRQKAGAFIAYNKDVKAVEEVSTGYTPFRARLMGFNPWHITIKYKNKHPDNRNVEEYYNIKNPFNIYEKLEKSGWN
ncbi:MAG: hypothetical protein RR539_04805 [Clostridium sp.]|uniref:hypothetical protein n=1 Tax=Clostridium sp. TaxID=1506 RepID=UPI002FCA7F12